MKAKSLYTICVNQDILRKTGHECIRSFFNEGIEGDLLVAYEGGDPIKSEILALATSVESAKSRLLLVHDLDKNEILNKVLEENKDVIPEDYGGSNAEMNRGNLPESALIALGAKKYFKYRASKWWRVFATLDAAAKQPDYEYVIQIDADVAFVKPITQDKIDLEMEDNAILYHEGPHRQGKVEDGVQGLGVETSFTVYSKAHGGYDIIYKLMDKLVSKDFKNYDRWDDSFLLGKIVNEEVDFKCRDASEGDETKNTDVVDRGPFKEHVRHFKGLNGGCPIGRAKLVTYLKNKGDQLNSDAYKDAVEEEIKSPTSVQDIAKYIDHSAASAVSRVQTPPTKTRLRNSERLKSGRIKTTEDKGVKLNLACGSMYLEGYINIDDNSHASWAMDNGVRGAYLDKVDKEENIFELEYEEESVDEVLLSHFMMYIDRNEAPRFINKIYRWLKPGGKFTVETGDLKAVCKNILTSSDPEYLDGFDGIRQLFGWEQSCCHKWAWCEDNLKPLFVSAGFSEISIERGIYHKNPKRDFIIEGIK